MILTRKQIEDLPKDVNFQVAWKANVTIYKGVTFRDVFETLFALLNRS